MKRIFLILFSLSLIVESNYGVASDIGKRKISIDTKQKLNYSDSPAVDWQDGLVGGNGEMGIMVLGDSSNETIVLNHEFLYEYIGTEDIESPHIGYIMPTVKQLIKEKKYVEARELIYEESAKKGHTELLWTDPYHPAGQIFINQKYDGEPTNYYRSVNYESGELSVNWRASGVDYKRCFFVSRAENIIVGRLEASKQGKISANFALENLIDSVAVESNSFSKSYRSNIKKIYPLRWSEFTEPYVFAPEKVNGSNFLTMKVGYQIYDRGYEVVVYLKNDGGEITLEDDNIVVRDANSVELLAKITPVEPYSNSEIKQVKAMLAECGNYDVLLSNHKLIHSEIFNRVELNLDKSGFKDGSNEELISTQESSGKINPYLLEKLFNMGRYTLISSSGKNPPNLMGIWNNEWRPTWSGDFTLDANINLQISSANIGNMPEAIDSYMSMLERLAPDWEVSAFKLFGCRGYYAGLRTSGRRGHSTHFMPFPGYCWTSGAEWLLLPCYEYYQCSGDKEFLMNRLFPMMEKVALFYEDFLDVYDDNDKYLFAPSYSPENNAILPNGEKESAVANSTIDISAAIEALTNIISVCEQQKIDHKKLPLWRSMLAKMPPYLINNDGALKEWARDDLGDNYDHRHISNLYGAWPGLEIHPSNSKLFNAAEIALEKRGRGNGSAHGLAHTALVAARMKNSNIVYGNLLYILQQDYLYSSLFTSHNPNRQIYNADALHTIPAVVMEMLVYSRPAMIELLPALSNELSKGSIKGVLCRTEAKVDLLEWDLNRGDVKSIISSKVDQSIDICLRKDIKSFKVDGEEVEISGDRMKVEFKSGQNRIIEVEFSVN